MITTNFKRFANVYCIEKVIVSNIIKDDVCFSKTISSSTDASTNIYSFSDSLQETFQVVLEIHMSIF